MEYILKASAVLCMFYVCYMVLLQKETFFTANRWFLLLCLIISCILPLIVIPNYINETNQQLNLINFISVENTEKTTTFNWLQLVYACYGIGITFFLIRFCIDILSLNSFLKSEKNTLENGFKISETKKEIAPFSFFKHIVYNPSLYSKIELNHILNHEKIHASEYHSIDILLSKITTILFWCNPIIWLYKKALIQNLEFIADSKSITQKETSKSYQKILLKTSLSTEQMVLTTNFYNSLIKKRILMLNTSKSKSIHAFKYAIIAPALLFFMMSFNTKTVYSSGQKIETTAINNESEVILIITNKDTDAQLDGLVKTLALQNVTLEFKNVKRNDSNEIIAIYIDAKSEIIETKYKKDGFEPITPIKITFNNSTSSLKIEASKTSSDIVFTATKNISKLESNNKYSFILHTNDGTDTTDQNVMFISEDGKTTLATTKTEDEEETESKPFYGQNPTLLIFLNGEEITKTEMETLDTDNIEQINILKGETAIKKYGEKAKDGVIEITLKKL